MASLQKLDTILYEVQQASLQMSLPPPKGIFDSSDENALLMAAVANLAGIIVAEAYDWQQLRKELLITGDAVPDAWDLPADFSRFVDGTGWSRATRRPVTVLNAQQVASLRSWVSQSFFANPACRIVADQLKFISPPGDGEVISFEYIDANWVLDGEDAATMKAKLEKNSDRPRFDWLLMVIAIKVKWLEQKGMSTVAAQSDFQDRVAQLLQHDQMGQVLTLSGPVPGGWQWIVEFDKADGKPWLSLNCRTEEVAEGDIATESTVTHTYPSVRTG